VVDDPQVRATTRRRGAIRVSYARNSSFLDTPTVEERLALPAPDERPAAESDAVAAGDLAREARRLYVGKPHPGSSAATFSPRTREVLKVALRVSDKAIQQAHAIDADLAARVKDGTRSLAKLIKRREAAPFAQ
jgi:hypothetical protein